MTATLAPAPAAAPAPRAHRSGKPLHRIAFLGLLAGTAVLYLWNLTATGYGNEFYAAATQAASQSWKALLFGSLDPGNTITVDKPPAFLWVSGLFAKSFGFSSWAVLAPQALEGVAAVALLYATVKRTSGPSAALFAGAAFALTPVATLMFRFNLPDALLVLLIVAAAYCTVRALDKASPWWLALAGTAIGFAFLTKMMQAFLVLPALALAYLVAAPASLPKRLLHLLGAGLAVVVSAGWYIVLVELWPADSRPYIGGSTNNSLWELAIGYNGLGRIFGDEGGGPGGGNGNIGFGGETGAGRLFGASMGPEISWLLPAAVIGLVAGLWFTRRVPRTDRTRAALVVWGGWTLVSGVVFSFMSGITHPYYTVALAPGIAALAGVAGQELWRGRAHFPARMALTAMVAATGVWGFILLDRTPAWMPWLRWVLLAVTTVAVLALVFGVNARRSLVGVLVAAALLGTSGYAFATAATTHSGSIPLSGPRSQQGGGMRESGSSTEVVQLLKGTDTEWAAATVGAQNAASLQLASGRAVIAIGGWNGSDPAPTLDEFKALVAAGKVRYLVAGGRGGPGGGNSAIGEWVAATFQATTVGGQTLYDLT
ncbi:phospholipid carrier-dependent glycosyltransferase [Lentzea sp. PSKA42]|uniref:Phospholipid carrier-dependent glycosyltransferase n=1 Tax=Lentzea indica TaxID=2604800 RepID=A0ABX1FE13_9PSEU|nr:glycosyltransferase family 39 protein [Lentzea indica]NKE57173.1 phospholipid carrier-dependent glycosyltransferase [Lentzea indica]